MIDGQYEDNTLFLTDANISHIIIVASSPLVCLQNCQECVGEFREGPVKIALARVDKGQLAV